MLHSAAQSVEEYYTLFNQKDWAGIAGMFDLPALILIGPRKIILDKPDAVTALYQSLWDKFAHEGAVRLSWDRGSFTVIQVHDDLAIVKTVVTRETLDRTPVKTWNCSYTVRVDRNAWRFTVVTSDDAGNASAAQRGR
jgi:hypothetical protein